MIKINLLPKEARKRVGLGEQIFIIVLVLILNFVGIGFYWSYLNGVIEQKQADIARTQQRLDELKKVIDEINKFEAQRQALEQKLKVIEKLEKEQRLPVRLLDEVYITLEDDLWLNSFTQRGEDLSVKGSALSHPILSNYMRKLDDSPYFDQVRLIVAQTRRIGTQDVRDFQINMKLTVPEDQKEQTAQPQQ